jgi:hypothetical protein
VGEVGRETRPGLRQICIDFLSRRIFTIFVRNNTLESAFFSRRKCGIISACVNFKLRLSDFDFPIKIIFMGITAENATKIKAYDFADAYNFLWVAKHHLPYPRSSNYVMR